ncbi:response regulator [Ramlibacter sp. AN1015]|uniref:ATP-binding response regulator n=1 Tax=Ramlibacter sp. AN1015 TaxID=3133428 RepID=UPI0030BBA40C
MLTPIRRLLDRYEDYHQREPVMHWYAGLLGTVGFPLFYLLRFAKSTPVYDDLWLRLVAAGMCALLLLRTHWPERLRPYFFVYSYAALVFTLPFMFVFTSLKNGGGTVAVANTLMASFFVILMTDWRNMVAMLSMGFGAAVLAYWGTDPAATVPADYVARLPILLLVLVGGTFFKLALERATATKVRDAYAAVAGSIAHEMRHPLGQVQHSLDAVQRLLPAPGAWGASRLGPAELDGLYRHVAQGQQAIERGLQVISMTLDQVNDEKPVDDSNFAQLSAAEVVRKAVDDYGYEDPGQRDRVEVQILEDFRFRGDETAFLYVLFNLLKNALYFIPASPELRINITVGAHAVRVRDTGPGIAPERLPELFEPFRSLGKAGGTGLGLRYCRRVMRSFGGDIGCDSRLGEYTEFTMRFPTIPLAEQEEHLAAVLAQARAVLAGRRLLLVDDDSAQRLATRHKLRRMDLEVDEAGEGRRALEMLAYERYDLVLMDLRMPVLDGWQLAGHIRGGKVPLNTDVRLVAHSSEPEQAARLKARRAGLDGFVAKPSSEATLARALAGALSRPSSTSKRVLEGRRVLLADDNPLNRRAMAAFLVDAGAVVQEAEHGADVLSQLDAGEAIDVVLLDLHMPGLGGLQTVRRIRDSAKAWASVPVVALTAESGDAARKAARAAGMNAFLVKPVPPEILCSTLSRMLAGERTAPGVTDAEPQGESLLNAQRLESYRRLGLLDDLVTEYFPEIHRLLDALGTAIEQRALPKAQELLHSLLGLSGEAAAQALHQAVRRIYVSVREEQRWPATADWLAQLRTLASRSEAALREFAKAPAASGTGGTDIDVDAG